MCKVFGRLYWTHDCFYLLHLGYKPIKSTIAFYKHQTIYLEFQEYSRNINKNEVICLWIILLLFCWLCFYNFSEKERNSSVAIAFSQDTHMGHTWDEIDSLLTTTLSLSYHFLIKNSFLKIYIWNRKTEDYKFVFEN
jgi:hypothetical protein